VPRFSQRSADRLATCHPDLVRLFGEVISLSDCTILQGLRTDEEQAELYRQGRTRIDGVTARSKHQARPDGWSHAVDVAPYPISWRTGDPAVRARWIDFARLVFEVAEDLEIPIRWGGDWDQDWDRVSDPTADQSFNDWPHWEIV
jgi:peptidoglycan L-alanyl-D-glutamate endopeptidase CwlK